MDRLEVPPSSRHASRLLLPIAAVLAVLSGACGSAGPSASAERLVADIEVADIEVADESDGAAVPDPVRAERVVEAGATTPRCDVFAYTPTTASEPRTGDLCVPASPTGEVVVLIHGGGGFEGDPDHTDVWRDTYLAQGRTTFTIEYALLDRTVDDATLWPRPEQNAKAAVQFVRQLDSIDAETIVVHGFSAGARIAGIVATTGNDPTFHDDELWPGVSDAVDGAVLFYGYYDGHQFYGDLYYGGAAPAAAVAIDELDGQDPALLIVHGTDDVMVPAEKSAAFATAATDSGVDATLVLVDGAAHGFDGYSQTELTPQGEEMVGHIEAFLRGASVAEITRSGGTR